MLKRTETHRYQSQEVMVKVKRGHTIAEPHVGVFSGGMTFATSRTRAKQLADDVEIVADIEEVVAHNPKMGPNRMIRDAMDRG